MKLGLSKMRVSINGGGGEQPKTPENVMKLRET